MSNAESCVLLDHPAPGVARLTLNRPAVTNALSLELQELLGQHFRQLAEAPEGRCIILTGRARVFAAGGDISGLAGVGPIEILQPDTERTWAPTPHRPSPLTAALGRH